MRVIGVVNDSVKILRAAAAYLRRHARIAATLPTIGQMRLPFGALPSAPDEHAIKFAGPTPFSWNHQDVQARDAQIIRWREQGVTHKEIAHRLGCTRQRVGQLLERIQERQPPSVAGPYVARTCWCGQAAMPRKQHCSPGHNPDSLAAGRNMLTETQYDALLRAQSGSCAICKVPESHTTQGKPKALSVDHCHATGAVRQLLCGRCNLLLGQVGDDPELLTAAANYLMKHRTAESSRAA